MRNTKISSVRMNKKTISMFKRNISGWMLILPSVLLFCVLVWRPIGLGVLNSFFRLENFKRAEFVGVENYIRVLTDTNFFKTLVNTVKYVVWSLIIGFPLPFICAVMINEMSKSKSFFRVVTYLPHVIPMMAVYLLWSFVYDETSMGLINSTLMHIGLIKEPLKFLSNQHTVIPSLIAIMSWHGFGGTVIMYLASLQSLDMNLYEAARLDGAGFWRRVWHILLPHCRGILLLMAVRQIMSVFGITEMPMVMTGGGPDGASLSLGLTNYFYAFKYGQMEESLALGMISFIILFGLTFVYFKLDRKVNE